MNMKLSIPLEGVGEQTKHIWAVLLSAFTTEVFHCEIDISGTEELRDESFPSDVDRTKIEESVVLLTRYIEALNYYIFTNIPLTRRIQ
jgi:hypothetical protein